MRADFSAKLDDQLTIGFPVIAVHLADVVAVSDLLGEGRRVGAHVGRPGIGRAKQAAVIHERALIVRVDPET